MSKTPKLRPTTSKIPHAYTPSALSPKSLNSQQKPQTQNTKPNTPQNPETLGSS